MKLEKKQGLLVASMTLMFRGQQKTIGDLVIDTGAVHTIISLDLVEDIGIAGELGDEIVYMHGIGGSEQSLRKQVDRIMLHHCSLDHPLIDFWDFSDHKGINGLVGLDIMERGGFVIDTRRQEMFQSVL